jgi:hypothetical protein
MVWRIHCPTNCNPETGEREMTRSLSTIARDIQKDWKNVYFGAVPYLRTMSELDTIDDKYGYDSGRSIVLYFLANAQGWKGEVARRIKAELKGKLKAK